MRWFWSLFKRVSDWVHEERVYQLVLANEMGTLADSELQMTSHVLSQRQSAFFAVDALGVRWRRVYLTSLCDEANSTRRRLARALNLTINEARAYSRTTLASNPARAHRYEKLLRELKDRYLDP